MSIPFGVHSQISSARLLVLALTLTVGAVATFTGLSTDVDRTEAVSVPQKARDFLHSRGQARYQVRVNDTLSSIAYNFQIPLENIERANPKLAANPRKTPIGATVFLPLQEAYE